MNVTRPVLVGLVAWLAVVAVGSTLVWTVISHVGDGLASTTMPRTGASAFADPGSTTRPSAKPSRKPSGKPSARPSGGPSGGPSTNVPDPTPPVSVPPASVPPVSVPPASSPPASVPPASSPPASVPPVVTARRTTWEGVGGSVVAECRGSAISLFAAQPDEGYRAEVKKSGPEEVEVQFEGREEESASSAEVSAWCESGRPRFEVEVED